MRILNLFALFVWGILALNTSAAAQQTIERADLIRLFDQKQITGGFVLFDPDLNQLTIVNASRATAREIPASTFKIANSLIALETGAVADVEEIIPYGGGTTPVDAWARDMSMRDAIKLSNVPVYQELARRVGLKKYSNWLERLAYGNGEIGADVETFWLKGPLRISAVEQTEFLARLASGTLPASAQSQRMVRDILRADEREGRVLFGKTGWTTAPDPDIGWYVGWIEGAGQLYTFALVMDVQGKRDADLRQKLTLEFLRALDVY